MQNVINELGKMTPRRFLFGPVSGLFDNLKSRRLCPELPDEYWLELGVARVLDARESGRAFLQEHITYFKNLPDVGHFFESLKSERRLLLCREVSESLARSMLPDKDPFADIEELDKFDLYAADGHWHGAAAHDSQLHGRKWAVGHLYRFNMRTRAMTHLDGTLPQTKHEHDLHVIKRLGVERLRSGSPQGRKVLYAYDSACIDFRLWHQWKQQAGIYFVTRTKDNMLKLVTAETPFEKTDPINAGVIADQLISTSQGVPVRMVTYKDPITGSVFEFITNENTLKPGLIAFLYRRRWDIEKVYDVFKNKYGQKKAWATSAASKNIQAEFLCITYNLILILEQTLELTHGIRNEAEIKRKENRLTATLLKVCEKGLILTPLEIACKRLTQTSVKFIRWLRSIFYCDLPIALFLPDLRRLYRNL